MCENWYEKPLARNYLRHLLEFMLYKQLHYMRKLHEIRTQSGFPCRLHDLGYRKTTFNSIISAPNDIIEIVGIMK